MKVYWWQAGVHIEPESQEERKALYKTMGNLNLIDLRDKVQTGPSVSIDLDDQQPVVGVDKPTEVFK